MLFESLSIILLKTIFCQYHNFFIAIFYLFFWCENALVIKLPWVMINNNHSHTYQFYCPCNRIYRRIFENSFSHSKKNGHLHCFHSNFFFLIKYAVIAIGRKIISKIIILSLIVKLKMIYFIYWLTWV